MIRSGGASRDGSGSRRRSNGWSHASMGVGSRSPPSSLPRRAEEPTMPAADGAVLVCLETGGRLSFASALDWPGWSRSGRGDDAALEALRTYAPRYAPVARAAGQKPPDVVNIEIIERVHGSATTDFGVLEAIAELERAPLISAELERLIRLLEACWELFDGVVAGAPATLRKGPRGGGRDREAIVDHVVGAAAEMYARKLGLWLP